MRGVGDSVSELGDTGDGDIATDDGELGDVGNLNFSKAEAAKA